ncbi:peptidylprolyl isomerase [Massilia sp. LXY-6]|uniref:peptidylprolyl isomerase n=1 Tax=Massilia sp. LXY-6 TaxID=3379823 RepID=UPI003EE0AF56
MQALQKKVVAALVLGMTAVLAAGAKELPPRPSVGDVLKGSKPGDWRPLDADNTLYLELPQGRVVIELAPSFAPNHVRNIKALAREHFYDGLAIIRSQDNFVVQWGDPHEDDEQARQVKSAQKTLPGEFTVPLSNDKQFTRMRDVDGFAPQVGHSGGFPAARDPKAGQTWLTHCYGMVGVARGNESDSGGGTSLYVVTGHAPRQLDRNITVVGRVVAGMPILSTLPRGPAPMGFYEQPGMQVPIGAVKVAADVPEAERVRLEVLRTESPTYQAVLDAQRNRGGPWNKYSPNYLDLCNAQIPVREQKL